MGEVPEYIVVFHHFYYYELVDSHTPPHTSTL